MSLYLDFYTYTKKELKSKPGYSLEHFVPLSGGLEYTTLHTRELFSWLSQRGWISHEPDSYLDTAFIDKPKVEELLKDAIFELIEGAWSYDQKIIARYCVEWLKWAETQPDGEPLLAISFGW